MQQLVSGSILCEDSAYFGHSEAFPFDGTTDQSHGACPQVGLDDTLERQLKASSFPLGDIGNVNEAVGNELHQPLQFQVEDNSQLLQDLLQQQHYQHLSPSHNQQQLDAAASWEESINVLQEMLLLQQHQVLQSQESNVNSALPSAGFSADGNNNCNTAGPKFPGESELLSLLQLPRCAASSLQTTFTTPEASKKPIGSLRVLPLYSSRDLSGECYRPSRLYDPHISQCDSYIPLQSCPTPFRNVLHNSLPQTYNLSAKHSNPVSQQLDAEDKDTNWNGGSRQYFNSQFDLKGDNALAKPGESRGINHFATERQRREYLNEKYQTLRSLVPNPTKADRASIVQDAIEYVKELKRTVQELQLLVQEKRRGGVKKRKVGNDTESSSHDPTLQRGQDVLLDGSQLRSSWLQRTSQHGTQVDVRIVDDEVNIKVTQKRRRNCLLNVVVAFYELQLDILHANGASIGEHHIYMFNAKMMQGSSTFAGHIVTKLIEAIDRQFSVYLTS